MTAPPMVEPRLVPFSLYRFWGAERRPGWWWAALDRIWPGLFWVDVLLYIGQTGRRPFRRLIEHVADQPWAHLMRCWETDPRVWLSEPDVLAAEKAAIRSERPRFNVQWNDGPRGSANRRGPRWRARRRWRARLVASVAMWLILFGVAVHASGMDPLLLPAVSATALLGWFLFPRSRRARRR